MGCFQSLPVAANFLVAQNPPASGSMWSDLLLATGPGLVIRYECFHPFKAPAQTVTVVNAGSGSKIVTIEGNISFGAVSIVRDENGAVVGALKTAQATRPMSGMESTSFDCYSTKPRYPGAVPLFSVHGVNMYPWARQTRKAFSNKTRICMAQGGGFQASPSFSMRRLLGLIPSRFTVSAISPQGGEEAEQGVAIGSKTKGEKPKRHEVMIASGVDGGLVVACSLMHMLLDEEIPVRHSHNHA